MEDIQNIEEIHLFTSGQKLVQLGYGEWVEEPDEVLFEHEGYKCSVIRMLTYESNGHAFGGYLCGYVQIPEGHKLYGCTWDDYRELDVHGEVTFVGKDKNGHFCIGFDCAHSRDVVPSTEKFVKEHKLSLFKVPEIFLPTYKNIQYCINECKSLAEQLANI